MIGVIDEARLLVSVQERLRACLAAAPWPHTLVEVATDVLADPARVLGGHLTTWALFPIACCGAACGDWGRALPAAVAAELYSTALDLLDDVEDGDRSPAVERYGAPLVLNLSTALLALAHTALTPEPGRPATPYRAAQDALWDGLAVATGGQHADLAAAGSDPLTVDDCIEIARRKGGALVEACCRAGAAFGTEDGTLIELFGHMGRSLGLAAQLDNDMHDADDDAGKSDLSRRKQTVPIVVARSYGAAGPLAEAVWQGGIQLAYALVHTERARVREALERTARACPDPLHARSALSLLLVPRDCAAMEAMS